MSYDARCILQDSRRLARPCDYCLKVNLLPWRQAGQWKFSRRLRCWLQAFCFKGWPIFFFSLSLPTSPPHPPPHPPLLPTQLLRRRPCYSVHVHTDVHTDKKNMGRLLTHTRARTHSYSMWNEVVRLYTKKRGTIEADLSCKTENITRFSWNNHLSLTWSI